MFIDCSCFFCGRLEWLNVFLILNVFYHIVFQSWQQPNCQYWCHRKSIGNQQYAEYIGVSVVCFWIVLVIRLLMLFGEVLMIECFFEIECFWTHCFPVLTTTKLSILTPSEKHWKSTIRWKNCSTCCLFVLVLFWFLDRKCFWGEVLMIECFVMLNVFLPHCFPVFPATKSSILTPLETHWKPTIRWMHCSKCCFGFGVVLFLDC